MYIFNMDYRNEKSKLNNAYGGKYHMKQSNENETIFKESMGEEWMEKQDSFFDSYDSEEVSRKDFKNGTGIIQFIAEALFNFF